jgi:hypothetical protein
MKLQAWRASGTPGDCSDQGGSVVILTLRFVLAQIISEIFGAIRPDDATKQDININYIFVHVEDIEIFLNSIVLNMQTATASYAASCAESWPFPSRVADSARGCSIHMHR